jgi:hypothetical protein
MRTTNEDITHHGGAYGRSYWRRVMTLSIRPALALALAVVAIAAPRAQADLIGSPAYSADVPGNLLGNNPSYSIGFEFTPTVNITVTALGYYDNGNNYVLGAVGYPNAGDGLNFSHQVAIYRTSDQSQVAFATVTPADSNGGTNDIGNGNAYFAYHALSSPVTLLSNTVYRIAANTDGGHNLVTWDLLNYAPLAKHTSAPFITTGPGVYIDDYDSVVQYPTAVDNANFYSTPNFLFTVVPEVPPRGTVIMVQ